jgi:MOSC domain-containing protein YiiM
VQLTICDRCAFAPDDYTAHDLATARRWLGSMADEAVQGVDLDVLATGLQVATLQRLHARIGAIDPDQPDPEDVHECIHLLHDLGRQLHAAGGGVPSHRGTVAQISRSDGGVPKTAVDVAEVGLRGLLGDRQATRKHHGRPFQALCLWSADVIDELRAEGHPILPGAAGENLTVAGLDWASLRGGTRLLVGDVLCEISGWATPCRKIDQWFTGRSDRIDHERHPGWSRAYAWVLEPGTVRVGDAVLVEP